MFKVGDHVRWTAATSEPSVEDSLGTITAVFPDDQNLDEFTLYDVHFDFGDRTLYGTQLSAVRSLVDS